MKVKTNKSSKLRDFTCVICFKPFQDYISPSDIKNGRGQVCSKKCQNTLYSITHSRGDFRSCTICNKRKYLCPSVLKRTKIDYVCLQCRLKDRVISTDGYWLVNAPGYKRKIKEHRWIMEQYLGRKIISTEIVHHINHNKFDNRLENLQIVTRSEHNKIHKMVIS